MSTGLTAPQVEAMVATMALLGWAMFAVIALRGAVLVAWAHPTVRAVTLQQVMSTHTMFEQWLAQLAHNAGDVVGTFVGGTLVTFGVLASGGLLVYGAVLTAWQLVEAVVQRARERLHL